MTIHPSRWWQRQHEIRAARLSVNAAARARKEAAEVTALVHEGHRFLRLAIQVAIALVVVGLVVGILAGVASAAVVGKVLQEDSPAPAAVDPPQLTEYLAPVVLTPHERTLIEWSTTTTTEPRRRVTQSDAQSLAKPAPGPSDPSVLERIAQCESGGNYTAEHGGDRGGYSSASGKYQVLDRTWDGYGGYSHASDAPPEVQEAWAAEAYAAAGTRPWNESRHCWGR